MIEKAKKITAIILTFSVVVFTFLAIFAIWDVFDEDVAWRSLGTLGVLFFASLVMLTVLKIVERKEVQDEEKTSKTKKKK